MNIFDGNTLSVYVAVIIPSGLTLADADKMVSVAAGLLAIAYTVFRWWKESRKKHLSDLKEETTTT